jgi:hypothetical protein
VGSTTHLTNLPFSLLQLTCGAHCRCFSSSTFPFLPFSPQVPSSHCRCCCHRPVPPLPPAPLGGPSQAAPAGGPPLLAPAGGGREHWGGARHSCVTSTSAGTTFAHTMQILFSGSREMLTGGRCRVHPCHCCVPVVIVVQYRGEVSQLLSQFMSRRLDRIMVATESEASRSTTAQCRLRTTQAAARFFLR